MKKRHISILLLCSMLCGGLLSCTSGSDSGDETTPATTNEDTAKEDEISDGLPDIDLNGWEMRIVAHHDALSDESTIYTTEQNGELINDIIYNRNADIQNRFNFTMTVIPADGWGAHYNALKTSVLAGSRDYDMAFMLPFAAKANLILDGALYNMLDVPYLDFEKPWWHTNVNDLFTYDGYLPFVSSDFLLSSYQYANILIFNKQIAEDFGLSNIYDTVRDGKWVLDEFAKTVQLVSSDLNGDGKYDENDRYGFATNFGYHAITFGYAIGETSVQIKNGEVELGFKDERFYNLADWMYNLFYTSDNVFEIGWDKECDIKWDTNQVFMQAIWVNDLEKFRSYVSDFGVIPYPKYDEAQENYYTYVDARSGGIGIPRDAEEDTVSNVGLVLEALSCASYKDLIPAYLESVTSSKLTRDDDSIEMLEIISKGRIWDVGYTFGDGLPYIWALRDTNLKPSGGQIASWLESKTPSTVEYYKKILDGYKELAGN